MALRSSEEELALLIVTLAGSAALGPIVRALTALGVRAAVLEDLETAGSIQLGRGEVSVIDPEASAYATATAPAGLRRRAHRALADAFRDDQDRRVWHLAWASELPDETIAVALERAADRAETRERASALLDRAAQLSAGDAERARRYLFAARAALNGTLTQRGIELLDRALSAGPPPLQRARIQHERGSLALHQVDPQAGTLLAAEATRIELLEPALAAAMLANASLLTAMTNSLVASELVRRARRLARQAGTVVPQVEIADAVLRAATGDTQGSDRILRRILRAPPTEGSTHDPINVAVVAYTLERYEWSRQILLRVVSSARAIGASAFVPRALDTMAAIDIRTGHWTRAREESTEALRLAEQLDQPFQIASCLTTIASIDAPRGDEAGCRRRIRSALEGVTHPLIQAYADSAHGLMALTLGLLDEAIEVLERLDSALQTAGHANQAHVPCLPNLIEAYVRAGRKSAAIEAVERLQRRLPERVTDGVQAVLARCQGLVASDQTYVRHFESALVLHEAIETPFERARTELCYGERLRRTGRRAAARRHLERALATFDRLGAGNWAARAAAELGEQHGPRGTDRLTARERHVASLVSDGSRNAEVARLLFVSDKTVEFHLANIYRKLGVRSRTELARRWAATRDGSERS